MATINHDPVLAVKDLSETTKEIIAEHKRLGIPMPIKDERCTEDYHFIMVYPDGREELILLDPETLKETVLRRF